MLLRRSTARPVLVCLDCRGVSEAILTNDSKQEGLFDFLFDWRFCLFVLLSWRENVNSATRRTVSIQAVTGSDVCL